MAQRITALSLVFKPTDLLQGAFLQPEVLGSCLQGVLMEHIDTAYARLLHQLPFNPYSQYCSKDSDGNLVWHINALTDEAAAYIIEPMRTIDSITVRSRKLTLEPLKSTLETLDLKGLLDVIRQEGDRKQKVRFVTPTAFKSQGDYVFMPSVRHMFQNLLMHYSQVYEGSKEVDADTVAYINQHVKITSYNLRSQYFAYASGEGKRIPAFIGTLTLSIGGPVTMVGLVRMLLKFGEYAGVGVKTSMGMGAFLCVQN